MAQKKAVSTANSLPSFDNPPLIEVVASVQFADLVGFKSSYLGELWEVFRKKDFPECEDWPPIPKLNLKPGLFFTTEPDFPRVWFKHQDGNTLLQFQRDRFCFNWRKPAPTDKSKYPRYEKLIPQFYKHYGQLEAYIKERGLQSPKMEMLELTYINIVPLTDFGGLSNLQNLFRDTIWTKGKRHLPVPSKINFAWKFELPKLQAIQTIAVVSAENQHTGEEVLKIEFSICGQAPSHDFGKDIKAWFSESHEWLVHSFDDIVAVAMKKKWKHQ